MNHAIQIVNNSEITYQQVDFISITQATLKTVATSTARVYDQTYRLWQQWCDTQNIMPIDLNFNTVAQFLDSQCVSKSTKQRQLSALRKLSEMLSILDYNNPLREAQYKSLKKLKVRYVQNVDIQERNRHALSPAQVDKILRVWDGNRLIDKRNRAIIAVLFMTAMRRSECANLRWNDVNFADGVIHIPHGKGDKARDVAIAGNFAIQALQEWKEVSGAMRQYVFCSMAKGDKLVDDQPTDAQTIYRVVKSTESKSGVTFTPHTARRTFISEALNTGTPLSDIQAQAGHSNESTTLRYARPTQARERRNKIRLRYG